MRIIYGRYDPLLRRRLYSLHDLVHARYHELQCRRNDRMVVEACGVALKASLIGILRSTYIAGSSKRIYSTAQVDVAAKYLMNSDD